MFKALFHKIGTAVTNYLMQEVESSPALTLNDFAALEQVLRPSDVILIEGGSRISGHMSCAKFCMCVIQRSTCLATSTSHPISP
jgi:hypothetical protein